MVRARDRVFWSRAPNAGDGQRRGRYVEIGSRPKSIADLWTLTAQTTTDGCTCTRMRLRFGSVRFEESSGLAHDSHDTKQRFTTRLTSPRQFGERDGARLRDCCRQQQLLMLLLLTMLLLLLRARECVEFPRTSRKKKKKNSHYFTDTYRDSNR